MPEAKNLLARLVKATLAGKGVMSANHLVPAVRLPPCASLVPEGESV